MSGSAKFLSLGLVTGLSILSVFPGRAFADFIQTSPSWGLDRIDQDGYNGDGLYHYPSPGTGVHVYVVSYGVRSTHVEFGGRVGAGVDFVGDGFGPDGDPATFYGSHVAGIAGAKTWGAAKNVTLHSVRVANSSPYPVDQLIAGVDWVVANKIQPAVLFITLTYTASAAYDAAVQKALDAGITVVAPVGVSSNKDACGYSPATVPGVISVGAITGLDAVVNYTSLGSCVDLFAPGTNIYGPLSDSDTSVALYSGTGQAAAFVAGAAAIYLEGHPTATPAEVHQAIISKATTGKIDFTKAYDSTYVSTSPNRILRVDGLGVPPAPGTNAAPVASFTLSCRKSTCSVDASGSTDDVGIKSYSWNFGDGSTGSGVTASHSYSARGTYNMTVTLTVTDGGGLTATAQKTVTIKNGR